jgi:hypothetical protein
MQFFHSGLIFLQSDRNETRSGTNGTAEGKLKYLEIDF